MHAGLLPAVALLLRRSNPVAFTVMVFSALCGFGHHVAANVYTEIGGATTSGGIYIIVHWWIMPPIQWRHLDNLAAASVVGTWLLYLADVRSRFTTQQVPHDPLSPEELPARGVCPR